MWLAWIGILTILIGIVSLVMGGAWSIFPVILGVILLAFWAVAMRGRNTTAGDTRSLPGDENVSGTHQKTGYAHEGQAPGHSHG